MIQGQWFAPGDDIAPLLSVRQSVFSRGADSLDAESWNTLVLEDGIPAATGRIWYRDGVFWLGDICVLAASRGRRLGDLTLRLLLFKAQSHSAREVRLLCPENTESFFARLGLRPVSRSGHQVEMMVPGDGIHLDGCKGCSKPDCPNRR